MDLWPMYSRARRSGDLRCRREHELLPQNSVHLVFLSRGVQGGLEPLCAHPLGKHAADGAAVILSSENI